MDQEITLCVDGLATVMGCHQRACRPGGRRMPCYAAGSNARGVWSIHVAVHGLTLGCCM